MEKIIILSLIVGCLSQTTEIGGYSCTAVRTEFRSNSDTDDCGKYGIKQSDCESYGCCYRKGEGTMSCYFILKAIFKIKYCLYNMGNLKVVVLQKKSVNDFNFYPLQTTDSCLWT